MLKGLHTPLHRVLIGFSFHSSQEVKQHKRHSTEKWIMKMYEHIHNETLFSCKKKKNEIMKFPGKWIELENILLSEVPQTQKY